MPLTPGEEYRIMLPATFHGRRMRTEITDDPAIPSGYFRFELEVVELQDTVKVRIAEEHTPCSYALCSDGQFQLRDTGPPEIGLLSVQPKPDGGKVVSNDIPGRSREQWMVFDDATPVILIYFTFIPEGAAADITDDGQPETAFPADGTTDGGDDYVRAFPADIQLPQGVEEKKLSRKKVRVILKKDR